MQNLTITMTTTEYERTDSGKSWRSKPVDIEVDEIDQQQVIRITEDDTLRFFRRLGGYERVDRGYTCVGYVPVESISISPDREIKKVRTFVYSMDN